MRKIPSVFAREWHGERLIRNEVTPGCEWVLAGEGVATRKWDGSACMVRDGLFYKRFDAKKAKTLPEGWIACEEARDAITGHWPGWVRVGDGPADRYHREAWANRVAAWPDGTYELVGPKVQGGIEGVETHTLILHGACLREDCPRDFEGIREYLRGAAIEGIVFWRDPANPDCEKAKVKTRDVRLPWEHKR